MSLSALTLNNGALVVSWSFPAPMETVWSGLTDPALQPRWLGTAVESDIRPGGILVIDHGEGYLCRSNVTHVDAPRRLAMTWKFPDEPQSRIAVVLHPSDDGTAAELTHTGLEDLAPSYGPGWTTHLTYLEAAVQGETIPPSQLETTRDLHGAAQRACIQSLSKREAVLECARRLVCRSADGAGRAPVRCRRPESPERVDRRRQVVPAPTAIVQDYATDAAGPH